MKTKEDKEVEEFLKNTPVIPSFLQSKNEGKIELSIDGFEKKEIPIEKIKENHFKVSCEETSEDFNILVDKNLSSDISIFGNGLSFDRKANSNRESGEAHKVFIGEYKLYSFSIREEDLSFSKYYIEKFLKVANSFLKNEEKAKELEEILSGVGFYIPKKIYVGGMIICHIDKGTKLKTSETFNSLKLSYNKDVKVDGGISSSNKSKLNEIFKSESTEIIGGNNLAKSFDEWIKSINLSNSNVIECTNIITVRNILDYNLKIALDGPLKIIEEKYMKRKKYLEKINEIKNQMLGTHQGSSDFSKGICKEMKGKKDVNIYIKYLDLDFKPSLIPLRKTEILNQTFNDVIVGFEIRDERNDGFNGKWTIETSPLGKKEINIHFESLRLREIHYSIAVYLM